MLQQVRPIRKASREMVRELGLLNISGMSISRCHALIELETHGKLTVAELADLLNLDKSTVSRTLSKLKKEGLVEAVLTQQDLRKKPFVLSDKGRQAMTEIHLHADQQVEQALILMPEDQREQVRLGLSLYARALARARVRADFVIRPVCEQDNPVIAQVIRTVSSEYGCDSPGFAFADPEVDAIFQTYQGDDRCYFIVELHGRVIGGGGYSPLKGEPGVCELQKMYFLPEARGLGLGAEILQRCLDHAVGRGYRGCYLETLAHMERAQRLYRGYGFEPIDSAMGCTGHGGCNTFYYKAFHFEEALVSS